MKNKLQRTLRDYMQLPYTIELRKDEEGDVIARVKELEGCVADGVDEMDALANLNQVKELWLSSALRAEQTIPLPSQDEDLPSGKFLVRVPRSLHKKLNEVSSKEGVSLNHFVTVSLALSVGEKASTEQASRPKNALIAQMQASGEYGSTCSAGSLRLISSYGILAQEPDPAEGVSSIEFAASKVPRDERIAGPQFQHNEEGGIAVGY